MILGKKIEEAINEAGVSIEAVAAHADMSVATLRRLLKKNSADTEDLIKISEVVKKPLSFFLPQLIGDEKGNSNINSRGIGNFSGSNNKQKIMASTTSGTATESSEVNIDKVLHELELCQAEKNNLEEKLQLKDQLLAMKDELINQLKK